MNNRIYKSTSRILLIIIVITMQLFLFAACDNNIPSVSPSPDNQTTPGPTPSQPNGTDEEEGDTGMAKIHFLNVSNLSDYYGSSLCVIIQHAGKVIMIDAGQTTNHSMVSREVIKDYLISYNITKVDHMILTHAHSDHGGGMPYIINNFNIGAVYMKPSDWDKNGNLMTKVVYEEVYNAAYNKVNSDGSFVEIIDPDTEGYRVDISSNSYFKIYNTTTIHENAVTNQDYNHFSFSILYVHNNIKTYIAGDSTSMLDDIVLGNIGKCQIYQLAHHGTAGPYSSQAMFDELKPDYAIVSGIRFNFGYDVYQRAINAGAEVLITEDGHIVFVSDGENVELTEN